MIFLTGVKSCLTISIHNTTSAAEARYNVTEDADSDTFKLFVLQYFGYPVETINGDRVTRDDQYVSAARK